MINATAGQVPKKKVLDKRIPTILGLAVLVVALIAGTLLIGAGPIVFAPRATPATTPTRIKVTNVTDNSFSVSFVTAESTAGFVKYGSDPKSMKTQSSDDRDQLSGTVGSYSTHHISVRGLEQNTTYNFVLGTGSGSTFDNDGQPFTVKTARRSGAPSAAKTIYGSVTNASGAPADGAIVYVSVAGAGELSSLVKNSGSWAVPLSNARVPDGSGYAQVTDETPITLNVQGPQPEQQVTVQTAVKDAQPAAAIALGASGTTATDTIADQEKLSDAKLPSDASNQADSTATGAAQAIGGLEDLLTQSRTVLTSSSPSPSPTATGSASPSPTPSPSPSASASASPTPTVQPASPSPTPVVATVDLNGPSGQVITTTQPTIVGTASPNVTVTITVHSATEIIQQVTAGATGGYQLDIAALSKNLEPGEHVATYSYTDSATGQPVTGQIAFVVAAASPSPTPYGTGNPYTVSPSPSPSPSLIPSPTPATGSGGLASDSGRVSIPSTESGIPTSGSVGATLALVIGGLFFVIAGAWSFWIASQLKEAEVSAK